MITLEVKLSRLLSACVLVFIMTFLSTSVAAYSHNTYAKYFYMSCQTDDYKMIGGISSGYWTYYPTTDTSYQPIITNAISSWSASGADFTRTSYNSSNSCKLNFALGNYGSGWGRGKTNFYNSSNSLMNNGGTPSGNWKYVIIQINKDVVATSDTNGIQCTIAHETGHSFGLDHFDTTAQSTSGIMHSKYKTRYESWGIYQPKSFELAAVKDYYGN